VRGMTKVRLALLSAVTIAALLVAAPALGVNRDGLYTGSTSQDRPIRFEVRDGEIAGVRISVFHPACNLVVVGRSGDVTFQIRDDNTFTMKFFGNERADRIVVRGEFTSRNRAIGTFRSVQDNRECRDLVRGTWRVVRAQ
jgi:hypothetical protein